MNHNGQIVGIVVVHVIVWVVLGPNHCFEGIGRDAAGAGCLAVRHLVEGGADVGEGRCIFK
eukprot:4390731-Ditylum_brightwellii.AAC.1